MGFLEDMHRTTVALSRAKEGMFILGCQRMLSAHEKAQVAEFWSPVLGSVGENIRGFLPVRCAHGLVLLLPVFPSLFLLVSVSRSSA